MSITWFGFAFELRFKTRAVEMRKIYATLRALIDVLELLVGDSANNKMGELIMEEVTYS